MHSFGNSVILIERWARRYSWGHVGPRTFCAFVAPVAGWVLAQWEQANATWRTEATDRNWAAAKQNRDDYAANHGGYNCSGFAIPGEVAAAARGKR